MSAEKALGTILQEAIQQHHDTRKDVYNAGLELLFEMARRIDTLEKRVSLLENPVQILPEAKAQNGQETRG